MATVGAASELGEGSGRDASNEVPSAPSLLKRRRDSAGGLSDDEESNDASSSPKRRSGKEALSGSTQGGGGGGNSGVDTAEAAGGQLAALKKGADTAEALSNLRISKLQAVVYPQLLLEELPPSKAAVTTVQSSRRQVQRILRGEDDRLLVIVGPCSIHDVEAAMDYARLLEPAAAKLKDDLKIVMRVYFEKPRTAVGWKGLINDPSLDGTFDINIGLRWARKLLCDINALGLPVGCEFLDTLSPQYLSDLVTWGAIGARTTECQLHRELASGLSMPVGFKNATSGAIDVAVDACRSAANRHCFLGITAHGSAAVVHSTGNEDVHVILRGGKTGTNFDAKSVAECVGRLRGAKLREKIVIDCSHGNSLKDHKRQPLVAKDICRQLADGQTAIAGVMIESNINEGNQRMPDEANLGQRAQDEALSSCTTATATPARNTNGCSPTNCYSNIRPKVLESLKYGVSVTDACLSWEDTVCVLEELASGVRQRRASKK